MSLPKEARVIREDWYRAYYAAKGAERNSLLHNPEVLYQSLAQEVALVRALQSFRPNHGAARVLDAGCGVGGTLLTFLLLGFAPGNLYGIDLQDERVAVAKGKCPNIHFEHGDATKLDFASESFDVVHEATMFIHAVDDELSRMIAGEMLRVTKPKGHILLCDWRYSKPGSAAHQAVTQKRIAHLFEVGQKTSRCGVFAGPLVPPVGRFLSRRLPSAYFLVSRLLPFLVGQVTTVLRKS
ncbi:MAG TPA: class I SAM-dependent methyltransferase [Terriglobia bacterium]|nr:class I SAM-dependent methyltransferase [Terriglobia bacterium]